MQTPTIETTQPPKNFNTSSASSRSGESITVGEGSVVNYASSKASINLAAVSVNAFASIMANSHDAMSIVNLGLTCRAARQAYQSQYDAQEHAFHVLMHNFSMLAACHILKSDLFITVPYVETAEWRQLKDQPLALGLPDASPISLLKKLYITSWDLLLVPKGLNAPQLSTLIRLVLDLSPHISNAQVYVKKLVAFDSSDEGSSREYSFDTDPSENTSLENISPDTTSSENISPQHTSPENSFFESDGFDGEIFDALTFKRFERLAAISLDGCLQLVLKHFSVQAGSPAYNFITAQCPILTTLNCLETIQNKYTSLLFYIVDTYPLTESAATRDALVILLDKLLAHGSHLEQKDQEGETPLVRLIDLGLGGKFFDIEDKSYVIELMKVFLKRGADGNARDKYGQTPLMRACKSWNAEDELISLLCRYSPDNINTTDNKGNTALHIAGGNKIAHLQALLKYSQIDLTKKNHLGESILHVVISYDDFPKLALLLQQPNIDVNAKNNEGESILHYAMRSRHFKIIQALLAHPDIDVNVKNKGGITAFHRAAISGKLIFMQALLEHPEIDVNVQDEKGNGALHWAIRHNNAPMVNLLLNSEKEINVNIRNKEGYAALHVVLEYGQWPIAQALLEHPTIDVNGTTERGSALEIALSRCDVPLPILQILLKKSDELTYITAFAYATYNDKNYIFLSSEEYIADILLAGKNEEQKKTVVNKALALAEKEKLYDIIDMLCREYGVVSELTKFEDDDEDY
jgi:ankyrin repeat protein